MSLDVWLKKEGKTKIICPHCNSEYGEHNNDLFEANITHNLGRMAKEAGIYEHLWNPDEVGIKTAAELIQPLTNGLELMKSDPERFKKFNAKNGWGTYDQFIPWIEEYLEACKEYPEALIGISR
jgi:hypothetical protein